VAAFRRHECDRLFFIQLYRWLPSVLKASRLSAPRPRAMAPSRLPPGLAVVTLPLSLEPPQIDAAHCRRRGSSPPLL